MLINILLGIIGGQELIIIIIVVLLLFGGKKLPELMHRLGKGIKEFKDATFEDASDYIHGSRLEINVSEDIDVYRKIIIERGLALISFNFRMIMKMEPEKARKIIMEYEEKQKTCKEQKECIA